MGHTEQHATLQRYWRAMNERDFDALREIFADDVLVEWPQSGEHFRGKDACVNVFANYPGGSPKMLGEPRVMGRDDLWVATASVEYPDGKTYLSVAILEFKDGKIAHEVDYFTEPFPAPEWRMQWVDRG